MLYRFNLFLVFAIVSVFALLVLLRVDNTRPNYQVILADDMTYSPAYTSFAVNQNFVNGRTQQEPVPGTIARGTQLFHFEPTPQDAIRAGEQLANPFDLRTEQGIASAKRGKVVFQSFCTACHGEDGAGNGPVARRGFPPPPSLLTGKSREMKDGQLFHILTCGQNSMPQFAAQLPPERRWDVINHIRGLQQKVQPPATEEVPTTSAPVDGQRPTPEVEQEPTSPLETNRVVQPDSVAPARADTKTKP